MTEADVQHLLLCHLGLPFELLGQSYFDAEKVKCQCHGWNLVHLSSWGYGQCYPLPSRKKTTLQDRSVNCTLCLKKVTNLVPQVRGDAQHPVIRNGKAQMEQSINKVTFPSFCMHQCAQVYRQESFPIVTVSCRFSTAGTVSAACVRVKHQQL